MIYAVLIAALTAWFVFWRMGDKLGHLPGPRALPILGNMLQIDPRKPRLTFQKWRQQYGNVYRVRLLLGDALVVTGYNAVYEVLVTKGHQFSERVRSFRLRYITKDTGIVFNPPGRKWRWLRKLVHQQIKQFSDGMAKLENIIADVTDDMLETFEQYGKTSLDPAETIRRSAVATVACLVVGEKLDHTDPLLNDLNMMEKHFDYAFSQGSVDFILLDMFPLLMYLPLKSSRILRGLERRMQDSWKEIERRQTRKSDSIARLLLDQLGEDHQNEAPGTGKSIALTETDVYMTCMVLLDAGIATTSPTFTFLLCTLAHRPEIQARILSEIQDIGLEQGLKVSLIHRKDMPYTCATIYETLRCYTPAVDGLPHATLEDTELGNYGIIPKGTMVITSLWSVHHDRDFWGDPDIFRPERFLDDAGRLIDADHPHRMHLLAFGAGPRGCIGEIFGLARLFLWTTSVVQRFQVTLAEADPDWADPNTHPNNTNLKPLPYKVFFRSRQAV